MTLNLCSSLLPRLRLFVLLTVFTCSFVDKGVAQQTAFSAAPEDISLLQQLSDKYEKQYKQDLATLPAKNKQDFEKIYKQRWDNIKEKFAKKEIYTDPVAQQYLDALAEEIVKTNPVLKDHPFRCYFSRSGAPNASYIGEGIILVNMGLFYRLHDENEVAFVMAHEIAHFLLKHSENAINRYVTTLNSDEVQEQLRAIKKSEYRKREQLEKLVKGLTFNNRRHGRDHEGQADSMAVELLHNTRFAVSGALSTLALLDNIDRDTLNTASCLQRTFNAPGYPFQPKWIAKEEGLLGGHAQLKEDKELEDSLKTHPDCKLRIKTLEPMVKRYQPGTATGAAPSAAFEQLKKSFPYEIIAFAFTVDNYTRSLYYTLELMQQKPGDPFLVAHTGKLLNSFFAAQKAHTLSKFIEFPSPDQPSNYNLLLQFVQNLYSENFASISYHFLKAYHPTLDHYEPFKTAYSGSIQIAQQ